MNRASPGPKGVTQVPEDAQNLSALPNKSSKRTKGPEKKEAIVVQDSKATEETTKPVLKKKGGDGTEVWSGNVANASDQFAGIVGEAQAVKKNQKWSENKATNEAKQMLGHVTGSAAETFSFPGFFGSRQGSSEQDRPRRGESS